MARAKAVKDPVAALQLKIASTVRSTLGYAAVAASMEDRLAHPRWCISTRIQLLDIALGGGLYEGRLARFYGSPSAGKTSLLDWLAVCALGEGALVSRQDPEMAFSPSRFHQFSAAAGVEIDEGRIIPGEPRTLEDLFRLVHVVMLQVNPVKDDYQERPACAYKLFFGVDTTSDAPMSFERESTLESEAKPGKKKTSFKEGMDRAKYIRAEMRKLSMPLALHGATAVVLEQSQAKIGSFTGGVTTGGGQGVPFKASQSALVSSVSPFQDSRTKAEAGVIVRIKTDKGRFVKSRAMVDVPLYYDRGFNDLEATLLMLEKHGCIDVAKGGHCKAPSPSGEVLSFPRRSVETFSATPEVAEALHVLGEKYKECLWIKKTSTSTKTGTKAALDEIDTDDVDDGHEDGSDE